MAEAAILAAVQVLGDPLVNEALKFVISKFSEPSELDSGIKNIRDELLLMRAFLNGINTHDHNNEAFEKWLAQLRNLAYHVEDIVDEFIYMVGHKKYGGIMSTVKLSFESKFYLKGTMSLGDLKRIASRLKEAEKSLRNLAARKDQWVSTPAKLEHGSNPVYYFDESPHDVAVSAHFIDDDELIGIETNRARLASWIYSEGLNLSAISVWGMGGLGKTTLVTNVYKREKDNFDCHAWISISQTFTVDKLLRNLIYEICKSKKRVPTNTTTMDLRELKETLRELLKEKKYLIVLDDAWDPRAFESIRDALIESYKGSRIVITSRSEDVASLAPEEHKLKVRPLQPSESWDLFCTKAFQNKENRECPPDLDKWAKEIVLKCNGLPLALVSIGGMLSLRDNSVDEWKRVHDQLGWELENNPTFGRMRNILNLSFNYLSRNLKNCFLYCCMFPEDHLLKRKKLIRLWIAEGFVEKRGLSTLEEVAEGYVVELVRRSMLQLVQKNAFGRIRRCQMHDTLRELAVSLCTKENFSLEHEENKNVRVDLDTTARRLSVVKSSNEIRCDAKLSQLRTFLSFDSSMVSSPLLSSILLHSMYLSVLDLEGLPIETLPETIGDLFNLRYLGLRSTKVKSLPKSIKRLRNLQTLDLYLSNIQKVPDGITKLLKLRHLFAEVEIDNKYLSFRIRMGIHVPNLNQLKNLQTLQALEANAEVVKRLENLNQLRSFRIWNVKESYCADLCTALSKMPFLSYLNINASSENEFLQLEHLHPPPTRLQKLALGGQLKENIFESPLFRISGKTFQSLYLHWSRLPNDPLPSLSYLSSLTFLCLNNAYDGQELVFRAGWFPKLKGLALRQLPSLIQVEMENDTMMSLERISLMYMKQLEEIPKGIEQMASLKEVHCEALSPNFWGSKKGLYQLEHFRCRIC